MLCSANDTTFQKKARIFVTIEVVKPIAPCRTDRIALMTCTVEVDEGQHKEGGRRSPGAYIER